MHQGVTRENRTRAPSGATREVRETSLLLSRLLAAAKAPWRRAVGRNFQGETTGHISGSEKQLRARACVFGHAGHATAKC